MTNEQIIFNASVHLMRDGVIKGTGRFFEYENEKGETVKLEEPEALHTFASWKEQGRIVKKGEKCKARIEIWKQGKNYTKMNAETGEEEEREGHMFKKVAYFFSVDQTEPIKAGE